MARPLLTHLVAQWHADGPEAGPAALVLAQNRGQDPTDFGVNNLPGVAFENAGNSNGRRAYDRALRVQQDSSQVAIYMWQQDQIFGLTAPPNWTSVFTVTNQVDELHTGLYPVCDQDGKLWICGFYHFDPSGVGWIRYDTETGVWDESSAAITGAGDPSATMGRCVAWRGRLWACNDSALISFDPRSGKVQSVPAPASAAFGEYAKPFTMGGRLFVATDQGTIKILELFGGGLVNHGAIAAEGHSINFATNGDFACKPSLGGAGTTCMIFWDCSNGGSGHRAHLVSCNAPASRPGNALTFTETGQDAPQGQNIPEGQAPSQDSGGFTFDFRYPDAPNDPPVVSEPPAPPGTSWANFASFHWCHAQIDWGYRPLFSPIGADHPTIEFANLVLNWIGIFSNTNRFGPGETARVLNWRHTGTNMVFEEPGDFLAGDNPIGLAIAEVTDHRGGQEREVFNPGGFVLVSITPYADGTIARGMLVRFRMREAISGGAPGNLIFGYGAANTDRIGSRMTLSLGDGIDPGGVSSLNVGLNRLEQVVPEVNAGNPGGPSRTLILSNVLGGPFAISESISAAPSGATGAVSFLGNGNMHVQVTGGAFAPGDTITGGTSGATATVDEVNGYEQIYQVIWDLGTDDPTESFEGEWIAFQAAQFAGPTNDPGVGNFYMSTTWEFALNTSDATPGDVSGPVSEIAALSTGSPPVVGGPVSEVSALSSGSPPVVGGPTQEVAPLSSASPPVVGGPTQEVDADTLGFPNVIAPRILNRPETAGQGGVVAVQINGVEQGARASFEFQDPIGPPFPGQSLDPVLGLTPGFRLRVDGVVELGRGTFDAVNDAVGTRQVLLDVDAANLADPDGGLAASRQWVLLDLVIRATNVVGVGAQPNLSVGVGGLFDDQAASQALTLTATGQVQRMTIAVPRNVLAAGDVLEAELDGQATATNYEIEIVAYGLHRTE